MKKFIIASALAIMTICPAFSQNNPPLNLDVLPSPPGQDPRSQYYRKLTPQETQRNNYEVENYNASQLDFDKKGERTFEGFAFDIDDKTSEFKVHTSTFGEIKAKLSRNTQFIPSKSAFKDGCYIIITQRRNLNAANIEIPAIWEAKKRQGWHSFSGALK